MEENNDNTYAFDKDRNYIKIKDALSGANGYYCIGCSSEMIAHKSQKIKEYFRHHPKDININRSCIWSDETTRHKLAMDILQINKSIKVPKIVKSPPDGNGPVYKIRDSEIIYAHTVEIEMSFFEDVEGNVRWKRLGVDELHSGEDLLIRPDVSFFDSTGKPILLIEIVVTNRIKEPKLLKIRRLGIDTVQVKIPTDSLESINTCFDKTTYTQWVYNYEEHSTSYLSISTSSGKGISSFDELPEGIHEETFKCRKNQIGNLIRAFERCLEKEPYTTIKRELDNQLLEVESHTERDSKQLRSLQTEYERGIDAEFAGEEEELRREESAFRELQNEIERLNTDEKNRVKVETRKLDSGTSGIEKSISGITKSLREHQYEIRELEIAIEELTEEDRTFNQIKRELEEQIRDISTGTDELRERIRDIHLGIQEFPEEIIRRRNALPSEFAEREVSIREKYTRDEELLNEEMDRKEKAIQPDFERDRKSFEEGIERLKESERSEFAENGTKRIERIRRSDSQALPEFKSRFEGLYNIGSTVLAIEEVKGHGGRIKKAKECFESKSWKNWDRFRDIS